MKFKVGQKVMYQDANLDEPKYGIVTGAPMGYLRDSSDMVWCYWTFNKDFKQSPNERTRTPTWTPTSKVQLVKLSRSLPDWF